MNPITVSSRRQRGATRRLIDELLHVPKGPLGRVSFEDLGDLPAPVERYFRTVLREDRPLIRFAHVAQAGEFRSRESPHPEAGWQPFEAKQVLRTEPPGFVWDARIRVAPLVSVRVRDAYVGGRASMHGALFGLVTVADAADDSPLRTGALQRYLAESVWFPTALLPRNRLRWAPVDETHARATLTDGETTATLEFEFGTGGEIVGCYTPARPRAIPESPGHYVVLPWGGRYRTYQERVGVRVPFESEVFWVVDGEEQPYYRGRNLRIEYDFGRGKECARRNVASCLPSLRDAHPVTER